MDSEKRNKNVETNKNMPDVPFVAYERAEAAYERNIKRLWILVITLIVSLFASNFIWIWFMYGTDFESYSADIDAGQSGDALYNYIGESMEGDINNGTYTNKAEKNNAAELKEEDNA